MKKLIITIISILVIPIGILSSTNDFRLDRDYCVFRNEDSRIFLEFYYSFHQTQLLFIRSTSGFDAAGELKLDIVSTSLNNSVIQRTFKIPLSIPDTASYNKNSNLTGQLNILLDSGRYIFHITALDYYNPADSVIYTDSINLSRFPENMIAISGIQLSSNIGRSEDIKGVFYKNTLEVVPNPLGLFGNNLSKLFYYFELYNIQKAYISEDYSIVSKITDLNDNVLKTNTRKYRIKNNTKVEYGEFDVNDLKTNSYKLVIEVQNNKDSTIVKNQKKFIIFNTDTSAVTNQPAADDYLLSEYANFTEKQIDDEFLYAIYIATDTDKDQFELLKTLESKRKFLFEFWKHKDIAKQEYFRRIKYANTNLKTDFSPGWKTDRGRVYCTYGPPTDIERHPFEGQQRAYEIWTYDNLQGGVIFVFADLGNATGNYGLIHSTARNEFRDDNWKDKLRIK
jgi:GWxTD domain-containing protein